jgi:hypothetical protein
MRSLILGLALCAGLAQAQYQPWDQVGIDTHADLNVVQPVPATRGAQNYRIWTSDGTMRWGWYETEPSGDFRQWDSQDGLRWGRIEVER